MVSYRLCLVLHCYVLSALFPVSAWLNNAQSLPLFFLSSLKRGLWLKAYSALAAIMSYLILSLACCSSTVFLDRVVLFFVPCFILLYCLSPFFFITSPGNPVPIGTAWLSMTFSR